MFKYLSINIFILILSSIFVSCGEKVIDKRISTQLESQAVVLCDTSIYGEDCSNIDKFMLVKKEELKPEYIKEGVNIGNVVGEASEGNGNFEECRSDNEINCITTQTYKSLDIEPYLDYILSSAFILGKKGNVGNCSEDENRFSSCYIEDESYTAIKKQNLVASSIKLGVSLGGIEGSYAGPYSVCMEDGAIGCITTGVFKGININNHREKIISTQSILEVAGTFVLPNQSSILPTEHYGINSNLTGTLAYCTENSSGCYLNSYSLGVNPLQAINYDDLSSKVSNIKNGYTLVSGIVGSQSECSSGSSNCYIEGNSLKAVDSLTLTASNIKHDISLGGVTGEYSGDYLSCTEESHTSCIADTDFPSVPNTLVSSLLSSASINGTFGSIEECNVGGSSCYINGDSLTAAESNKLLATNIHHDLSLGGVTGSYNGDYTECSVDGSQECIANSTYKAIDINNHTDKIISSESIFDVAGTFIVPSSSDVLSGNSYGIEGSLLGSVPTCLANSSGCYLDSYSEGINPLQALDYDDLYSKRSYIQNGYTLVSGIVGNQSVCSIGGNNCYIDSNEYKAAESEKLIASNIKHDVSIGNITGSYNGEYSACTSDVSSECISTSTYKAININNHRSKIISSYSIGDISGTFTIPSAGLILPSASYGPNSSLSGTAPYCSANGSGCYIKPYSQGTPGYGLQALDYDDLSSKTSYIKNGYTLAYGITGTQSVCSAGGSSCYIDSSFKAVESSNLIASYIKHGLSLGGVSGSYNGDYPACTSLDHTDCIADSSYPSVPEDYTSYLLATATINNSTGYIVDCSGGDSYCYINGNTLKAAESEKLISSNIKHDISLGGVTGNYTGPYSACSGSSHTSCIADSSYPSVPAEYTNSLLSSASINGVYGGIDTCSSGDSSCYISSVSFKAAESEKLLASNIKLGVSIGGVNGGYPSAMYPLHGADSNITDLTTANFNSLMVSPSWFEWFDSAGNRYFREGSSELVASNIKDGVDVFGVTGNYSDFTPTDSIAKNKYALALKKKDGTVVCFGDSVAGGYCSDLTDVVNIVSHEFAFAALKSDGTVVSWGDYLGDYEDVKSSLVDVVNIFSTRRAFAALKSDGSVVVWGDSSYGGNPSYGSGGDISSGVVNIFSNEYAFAALKSNGSVITWGEYDYGGRQTYYDGDGYNDVDSSLTSGVVEIYSTISAFAALKSDGSVVTWGGDNAGTDRGGNSDSVRTYLSSGVTDIFSNEYAFAALKSDGTVVSWGDFLGNYNSIKSSLVNVIKIFSGYKVFVALKNDGSIVVWGNEDYGGNPSYSDLGAGIMDASGSLTNITDITFTNEEYTGGAVAALKSDGSVVTWGYSYSGGDSSSVSSSLSSGVTNIYSTDRAFAALKSDGTVVAWGEGLNGMVGPSFDSVKSSLTDVIGVFSTHDAFVALKEDGSVVTWGNSSYGGDSSSIINYTGSSSLTDIVNIFSAYSFFIGVREDDTYVVWGAIYYSY